MQKLLMLVASLSLIGCGMKNFPEFPDVSKQYLIDMDVNCAGDVCSVKQVNCVEFEILSKYPYKLDAENPKFVELAKCNGVGGFTLEDTQKILNWSDDVQSYFDNHKCMKD